MSEIIIENGIPLPRFKEVGLTGAFMKMKIGDSCVWNGSRGSVYALATRLSIKVTVRSIEGGKVRIWRIA